MKRRAIRLDDEAYERLAAAKRPDEDFSDVVLRLTERRQPDEEREYGVRRATPGGGARGPERRRHPGRGTGDEDA